MWTELAERQIAMAWRQRNDFALANLHVREEILRRAAELCQSYQKWGECGSEPPRRLRERKLNA